MTDENNRPPLNYSTVDPIGEIRRHAEELYLLAGSPKNQNWEDFFAQAENNLLQSQVKTPSTSVSLQPIGSQEARRAVDPHFAQVLKNPKSPVLAFIAEALPHMLDEHEALSLANLLWSTSISLKDGSSLGPLDVDQAVEVIAPLSNEIDQALLQGARVVSYLDLPSSIREEYWRKKLDTAVTAAEWAAWVEWAG